MFMNVSISPDIWKMSNLSSNSLEQLEKRIEDEKSLSISVVTIDVYEGRWPEAKIYSFQCYSLCPRPTSNIKMDFHLLCMA